MRRFVAVIGFALVVAGCTAAPAEEVQTPLLACDWNVGTTAGFTPSFQCLDGSTSPAGLPAPAIVNVWGSWCPPCRQEIPYFIKLDQTYDVTIIGVDVDEPSLVPGQRFAQKSKMTWPNLIDVDGTSTTVFGEGVPVTWFIDAQGRVALKKIGAWKSYEELERYAKMYGQIQ